MHTDTRDVVSILTNTTTNQLKFKLSSFLVKQVVVMMQVLIMYIHKPHTDPFNKILNIFCFNYHWANKSYYILNTGDFWAQQELRFSLDAVFLALGVRELVN